MKNIITLITAVVLFGALSASAQIMDTISYVPVKKGYYDKISTKSYLQMASSKDYAAAKTLQVNSSTLDLYTTSVTFGKPVYVKDNIFIQGDRKLAADKAFVQGKIIGSGPVVANLAPVTNAVIAGNLNMPNRAINMGSNSFTFDGMNFPAPSCQVSWKRIYSDQGYVNVLGCAGGCTADVTEQCGNCGTCTRVCNASTGVLGSCGTCQNQGCQPGKTQVCGGNGTQICSSSCGWSTCSCPEGYTWNGTTCVPVAATAQPVVKTAAVSVDCSGTSGGRCTSISYSFCRDEGYFAPPSGYDTSSCGGRSDQQTCYNDYLQGGDEQFNCTTMGSLPQCPAGADYANLCNGNGKGYQCMISASGSPSYNTACMCEWYGNHCGEASGLSCVTIALSGKGSGKYLSCE